MDPHPLQIDLVLEKVFANFGIQLLLICRQVCRKWEEISTPKLVRIIDGAKSLDFYEAFQLHPIKNLLQSKYLIKDEYEKELLRKRNLGNYLLYLETSPRIIPSVITISFTRENITIRSNCLQKFFWKYGHTLHHLTLSWCWRNHIQHLSNQVRKPVFGSWAFVWPYYPADFEHFPNFFRNLIFTQCKNLKRLELIDIPETYINKSFTGDGYNQPTNITELLIHHGVLKAKVVYNFARNIFNSCPKLEKLEWFEFDDLDQQILISLLKTSKCFQTLKTFKIFKQELVHPGDCSREEYLDYELQFQF